MKRSHFDSLLLAVVCIVQLFVYVCKVQLTVELRRLPPE